MAMLKRAAWTLLCSVFISVALAQSTDAKKKKEPIRPLFSVDGDPVSTAEFIYLYNKNHLNKEEDFTVAKIEEYLDLFVNFKLKVHDARRLGMDTVSSFINEYNSYRDELRKPYLPDGALLDSLVHLTYERLKYEVKASHILIAVDPDAPPEDTLKAYTKIMDIRTRILEGNDFGQMAMAYSADPSAKVNNGNLGYFTAMQMTYRFETAAYQTTVGEVSLPVRTRYGYHIIKVFDKRPSQGEVEVSHIMIRTGSGADDEKARNTIFSIYDQLQAGVKWEELCKQYSEDPATKNNGGRLRPIATGSMNAVPEFESTAFNLQHAGEISDPFHTSYGWHIVRLERKIPLATFDILESSLKKRVARDDRMEYSKKTLQDKLRKEYHLNENRQVMAKVLAGVDSTLQKGSWRPPEFPEGNKTVLFQLNGRNYFVQDFLTYAQKNQSSNALPPGEYLTQLYNNFVNASILEEVEKKIISQNPTYRFLLTEYYEGILLFEIMEKEVWNKASEDSVGQRRYFEANRVKYGAGERAKAILYSSITGGFEDSLKKLIVSNEEDKLRDFIRATKISVESGYYTREDAPLFKGIPWVAGVYSTENNGKYYLAWLKEILPPGTMSFEEARPAVISDYQAFLEEMWLKELKKKYTVRVNGKGKKYILQELESH